MPHSICYDDPSMPYYLSKSDDFKRIGKPRVHLKNLTISQTLAIISSFLLEWSESELDDIVSTPYEKHSGMSSRHWIVENKNPKIKKDPKIIFLTLWGGAVTTRCYYDYYLAEEVVAMIYQHQSRKGQGPKLLGMFPGGCILEYLVSHNLNHQIAPKYYTFVARAYARYHAMDIPMDKKQYPRQLKTLEWDAWKKTNEFFGRKETQELYKLAMSLDLSGWSDWAFCLLDKIGYTKDKWRVIHHDVNIGNVCVLDKKMESDYDLPVVIVDYEMSAFGPRSHDLAGHLWWSTMRWEEANYKIVVSYPSDDVQFEFVSAYLDEWRKVRPDLFDPKIDNPESLMEEMAVGYFLHGIYIVNQASVCADEMAKSAKHDGMVPAFLQTYAEGMIDFEDKLSKKYGWPRLQKKFL